MFDFKPTVDLREKMNNEPRREAQPDFRRQPPPQLAPKPKQAESKPLPKELEVEDKKEFQRISRPSAAKTSDRRGEIFRVATAAVMLVAVLAAGYWFWYKPWQAAKNAPEAKWYKITLLNYDVYYGQVRDISADPVVVENTYENYEQYLRKSSTTEKRDEKAGDQIKLLKLVKEVKGVTGTISMSNKQIIFQELDPEGPYLKAILEYERK